MILIGATLGSDLDLRAAKASILRVIAVGDYLEALNRILRRGHDGCAAPHGAGCADAVNRDPIARGLTSIGADRRSVFCVENAGVAARRAATGLGPRKVKASPTRALRAI